MGYAIMLVGDRSAVHVAESRMPNATTGSPVWIDGHSEPDPPRRRPRASVTASPPPVPTRPPEQGEIDSGIASWYAGTVGWRIPHAAVPGGHCCERSYDAEVCSPKPNCITVAVVDACGCPGGRIIDLSRSALDVLRLDPLRGLYQVTVERLP